MKLYRGRLFHHIHLKVKDINRSREFYRPVIESLGLNLSYENSDCLCIDELLVTESSEPSHAIHLAFQAEHPAAVKLFYEAALKSGGRCNGAPGLKSYSSDQYAAYVLDPDGNNIEAVFHGPRVKSTSYVEISTLREARPHL